MCLVFQGTVWTRSPLHGLQVILRAFEPLLAALAALLTAVDRFALGRQTRIDYFLILGGAVTAVAFTPDAQGLISVGEANRTVLWNVGRWDRAREMLGLEGVLRPGGLKPVLQTKSPRARHGVQPLGCTDPGQAKACTPNLAHGLIRRGQAEACTPNDEITRT